MARLLHPATASGHRPLPVSDLDHLLATTSIVLGAVGLVLVALDIPAGGVLLGIPGMLVALWAQMVSRTRGERFADMTGLLLSFLALATGLAEGGL